ncbi:hypothetical protein HanXRQr2_Chr10g0451351 [Helianthus annuus]|uniref:Uncharacterized protein n=1 Tax=Helianthus annuus TaxID=4232 RepID=A0A9K3HZM6_HELAN|nr:hypothetical protein HanXRQr2_Chr10g0451351 [Helianthus annuus]
MVHQLHNPQLSQASLILSMVALLSSPFSFSMLIKGKFSISMLLNKVFLISCVICEECGMFGFPFIG